jgi:D-glycero-D-manno-heptose 1,7-bisphosphate phosphatase
MMRRAIFLDRDGTLIEDADYLSDPDDIVLIEGAVEALRRLRARGWAIVVVTNQSGVARGRFTMEQYRRVADALDQQLSAAGCRIDATCMCPHHPTHSGGCACRKPQAGMLLAASAALGLDPTRSFMIGDKKSDVQAGLAAGASSILVRTGYGRETEAAGELPVGTLVVDSIGHAVDWILAREAR